jgi:hypothetical protein
VLQVKQVEPTQVKEVREELVEMVAVTQQVVVVVKQDKLV